MRKTSKKSPGQKKGRQKEITIFCASLMKRQE
jgi:hypothetical protein